MRDHLLERAVLSDQLARGLVADTRDARDVVRRVALEPDEVRDLVGPDAVAELDPFGRVDVHIRDAAWRHHQRDVRRAELEGVAVGRDDRRLHARLVGARGERRDHVIRLPALELQVAVAERLHDRLEMRELLAQQVGHRPAALLVDHIPRLRDRRPVGRARVPGDRDALGAVVREQLEEHVREPEEGVGRKAVARRKLLRKREKGAVGEVVAVDEEELGVPRGAVVELQLLSGEGLRRHRFESTGWLLHGGQDRREAELRDRLRPRHARVLDDLLHRNEPEQYAHPQPVNRREPRVVQAWRRAPAPSSCCRSAASGARRRARATLCRTHRRVLAGAGDVAAGSAGLASDRRSASRVMPQVRRSRGASGGDPFALRRHDCDPRRAGHARVDQA